MEAVTSMSKLQAEVRALSARVQDHGLFHELSTSQLSAHRYKLVLWVLRQVHLGAEAQLDAARQPSLKHVRSTYRRKVPFLERDLVAACGKELTTDRRINEPLDRLLHAMARPTTPARVLGRLMFLEALLAGHALPLSGFAASPALPSDAAGYLGLSADAASYEAACKPFKDGLTGEVPRSNAMQAAGELAEVFEEALNAIVTVTSAAGFAARERSA